jgi:hypothetical protein
MDSSGHPAYIAKPGLPDFTYQNGKNIPKTAENVPNGSEKDKMAITFTSVIHFKTLRKSPELVFLV